MARKLPFPNKNPVIVLIAMLALCASCAKAPGDPWSEYADAIDRHLEAYIRFNEPDEAIRREIWQDYERAKEIRREYHATGTIPRDPLAFYIYPGRNSFAMDDHHVAIVLSEDPGLECGGTSFTKPAGGPAHFAMLGGNDGFWVDKDIGEKFISMTATLPEGENTLQISSNSWSPGKIYVAFAIGTVIGLTGCKGSEDDEETEEEDTPDEPETPAEPTPTPPPPANVSCRTRECPEGNALGSIGNICRKDGTDCRVEGVDGKCVSERNIRNRMAVCTCTCNTD